jgi:hypothetical protein
MATPAESYRNDPRRAKNEIVSDINDLYPTAPKIPGQINDLLSVTFCAEMTRTP